MKRYLLIAGITAAALIGALWHWHGTPPSASSSRPEGPFKPRSYSLLDHNGAPVTEKSYPGKFQLVFFGYTYCPDVCPTELLVISEALDLLGDDAKHFVPIFITVDPDHDTPETMKDYVENFHPSMIGLTGGKDQIRSAANSFRARYIKITDPDGDPDVYYMGHTASIHVTDPGGMARQSFKRGTPAADMAARLKRAIAGTPSR